MELVVCQHTNDNNKTSVCDGTHYCITPPYQTHFDDIPNYQCQQTSTDDINREREREREREAGPFLVDRTRVEPKSLE